jgi:hypothetical protein
MSDSVNHPSHYTTHPSGVECIDVAEHMGFNLGNVMKYVWRADSKGNAAEDLRKAAWYLEREIQRRSGGQVDVAELPTDRQRLCRFMQDVKSLARPKIESQWANAKLDEMIEDFLLDILELAHATKP